VTLALLLGIGGAGAAAAGWGMSRGDRLSRAGAAAGIVALLAVLAIALVADAPPVSDAPATGAGLVFGGRIVRTDYLRLVVALWALDGVIVIGLAWLLGGLDSLRGLLAGTLAAIVGGIVALGATDLSLGVVAAAATGLAALVVILPPGRGPAINAAARELRVTLAVGALLLGSIAVAPIAAALALAGTGLGTGAGLAPSGEAAGAGLGLVTLATALGVGVRFGVIPFHLRVPRLTDAAAPAAMPLLVAWMPLPLAVAALAMIDHLVAPLALPLDAERWIVVVFALLTLGAAALAAFIQDDLRHSVGYLVIADAGLVLLGIAALDPAAWGPTRIWLVAMAASKTALAAWSTVMESRFETRSVPDLRGWIRRSPILAAAFVVTAVATFGLPGWIVFGARGDLARLAADGSLEGLLIVAGLLTLPTYLRLLTIGLGPASSHVSRATPERFVPSARPMRASRSGPASDVEPAGPDEATRPDPEADAGAATAGEAAVRPDRVGRRRASRQGAALGRRFTDALRRDRAELMSAAVLALAVVAALTSWGALDLGTAASEPAPIVTGPAGD